MEERERQDAGQAGPLPRGQPPQQGQPQGQGQPPMQGQLQGQGQPLMQGQQGQPQLAQLAFGYGRTRPVVQGGPPPAPYGVQGLAQVRQGMGVASWHTATEQDPHAGFKFLVGSLHAPVGEVTLGFKW